MLYNLNQYKCLVRIQRSWISCRLGSQGLPITIVIAGALNIAPVLLALCLNDQEDRSGLKKMQMAAFSGVFLILFISTAILRWTSRQDLFASETGIVISGVQDTGGSGSAMTDGALQGQPFQDMEPENIEIGRAHV